MKKLILIGLTAVAASNAFADLVAYDSIFANDAESALLPLSSIYSNSGSALSGTVRTTRFVADDIEVAPAAIGWKVRKISTLIYNSGTAAVNFRGRMSFYAPDETAAGLTTRIGGGDISVAALPGSNLTILTVDFGPAGGFALPSYFWAGISFDNTGFAATTNAQMNALANVLSAPRVGSSEDLFFRTSAANPGQTSPLAGIYTWFGGAPNPKADFAWKVTAVPEPATMLALGAGLVAVARRRRSK